MTQAMLLLPTTPPSWVIIYTSVALIPLILCVPLTPPSLSLSTPFSLPLPLNPPQNTTALTTWPTAPFDIPIPHLTPATTLSVIATGPTQAAKDKSWLLTAIALQQSVYRIRGGAPQGFNIWNEDWRFYMVPGGTPPSMAMAVGTLQLYRGLVLAYGMATMAFVVRVGDDVRGFYWVTVRGWGEVGGGGGDVNLFD